MTADAFARIAERDRKSNNARRLADPEKHNKYHRDHYATNIERERERNRIYARRYREANREHVRELARKRYDPEKKSETAKAFRKRHRQKLIEREKEFRKTNPEKVREWYRNWKKRNPDVVSAKEARRRRCRSFNIDGWSEEQKKSIKMLFKLRDLLNSRHGKIMFHIDHIIPLAKGGSHHPDNLRLTTASFNCSKRDAIF